MRVSRHVTLTWCGPSKVLLTTSMTGQGRGPKETISEVALARQECTKASACMSIESDRGGGGMGRRTHSQVPAPPPLIRGRAHACPTVAAA